MATSSILENVRISDSKEIDEFVKALELSADDPEFDPTSPKYEFVTDKDKILQILQKRYLKNG